jgi:hypothetical protein
VAAFYRPGADRRPTADGITSSRHHHVERASAQTTDKPASFTPLMGKFLDTRIFGGVSV